MTTARVGYLGAVALGALLAAVALSGCDRSPGKAGQPVDDAALRNEADGTSKTLPTQGRVFGECRSLGPVVYSQLVANEVVSQWRGT
jgi:hypothetical protein